MMKLLYIYDTKWKKVSDDDDNFSDDFDLLREISKPIFKEFDEIAVPLIL